MAKKTREECLEQCEGFGLDEAGLTGYDPEDAECIRCKEKDPDIYAACEAEQPEPKGGVAGEQGKVEGIEFEDRALADDEVKERFDDAARGSDAPEPEQTDEDIPAEEEASEAAPGEGNGTEEPEPADAAAGEEGDGEMAKKKASKKKAAEAAKPKAEGKKEKRAPATSVVADILKTGKPIGRKVLLSRTVAKTGRAESSCDVDISTMLSFGKYLGVIVADGDKVSFQK